MRSLLCTIVVLVVAAACDRGHHSAPAHRAGCTLAPLPWRIAAPQQLVAIGDLHGDFDAARAALRAAGAIDGRDRWIGGDLTIVQLGDVLDRGGGESRILELLARLDREARAAGGAVIMLLGNHELMNAAGDFRYTTPAGMRDFGGDRVHALGPGGPWAKRLARHDVVMIVGDTVFSHAGVLGDWVSRIAATNRAARCWLDGQAGDAHHPPAVLTADDSPVWTRVYGEPGAVDCAALGRVLHRLGARRMVVGHTVQAHGITSACDGALWRIDVGMTAVFGGPIEVLAIDRGASPRVIRGHRG